MRVWQGIFFGLGAGTCWAVSPVFFRWGYAETPSIYLAVLLSLLAGAVVSLSVWLGLGNRDTGDKLPPGVEAFPARTFWSWQIVAGVAVGMAVFARWLALLDITIVAVNSINMLAVPIIVIVAPLVWGRGLERSGWRLWLGVACVLSGVTLVTIGGL